MWCIRCSLGFYTHINIVQCTYIELINYGKQASSHLLDAWGLLIDYFYNLLHFLMHYHFGWVDFQWMGKVLKYLHLCSGDEQHSCETSDNLFRNYIFRHLNFSLFTWMSMVFHTHIENFLMAIKDKTGQFWIMLDFACDDIDRRLSLTSTIRKMTLPLWRSWMTQLESTFRSA